MNGIQVMETPSFENGRALALPASMSTSRLWRAYRTEAWYESLRMLRSPAFAIPFLGLPVVLYLMFAVLLFGDAMRHDPKAALFTFVGFDVLGVMGPGLFGFGITLAMEREQGLLTLKRALPMPPGASLIAKLAMAMLFGAVVTITMVIAALTLGHLPFTPLQCLGLAFVNIMGAAPFCALGMFIGTRTSGKAAPAIANLFYLAMIYLSGILLPLPKSMWPFALASPAYHLDQLVFQVLRTPSQGPVVLHVGVLAAVTLVLTAFSVRRLARIG